MTEPLYAFDVSLHARPAVCPPSAHHADAWGTWPTVAMARESLAEPLAVGFDDMLDRLGRLERMYVEPDGAFVWTSPREGLAWQVDGNASEWQGRVLLVDLRGSCPPEAFDRLLDAVGWPTQPLVVQLVRPAVFLDEATFRRHALARGAAGDGETLRPT